MGATANITIMPILPLCPDDYLLRLPQVNENDVRICWHCNFYDGPLNGVLLWDDMPCWFENRDQDNDFRQHRDKDGMTWNDWYQRFLLIALPDAQYREMTLRHTLFRDKVGTYWDYDGNGKRKGGSFQSEETMHEYYELANEWAAIDLSNSRIVGWVEWLFKSAEVEENLE